MSTDTVNPADIERGIAALVAILQAHRSSLLRFLDASYPYHARAAADVRRSLREMVDANVRQIAELGLLIESLGGLTPPPPVHPEDQYCAFLSIAFILPKLLEDRRRLAQLCQTALAQWPGAPDEVLSLLRSHLAELQADVVALEKSVRRGI